MLLSYGALSPHRTHKCNKISAGKEFHKSINRPGQAMMQIYPQKQRMFSSSLDIINIIIIIVKFSKLKKEKITHKIRTQEKDAPCARIAGESEQKLQFFKKNK